MAQPESIYDQYKKATADVLSWLKSFLTGLGPTDLMTVARILQAADLVKAAGKAVPSKIMKSLEKAITLREKVAAKHKSPDEGHMHFVEVLKEMRAMFSRSGKKVSPNNNVKNNASEQKGKQAQKKDGEPVNRFEALSIDEVVSETDETFGTELEPAVAPAEKRKEWEDVDIAKDTEWFMIRCFLSDLDNLMGHVRSAWDDFKEYTVPIFVPTAITNFAVFQVVKLSATLQLDYPHLTTLDHIIAVMYYALEIGQIMTDFPYITYSDAVEVIVLGRWGDDPRLIPIMTEEIKRKLQCSHEDAGELVAHILEKEEIFESHGVFFNEYQSLLFFQRTQQDLAGMMQIYNLTGELNVTKELLGPKWNEMSNPAKHPSTLLMEYSTGNVLPALEKLATRSRKYESPEEKNVIPLVSLFRDTLMRKVVGVETAFAWHAMIWAAFVYQGDMRCSKLSVNSSLKLKQLKERLRQSIELWDVNAAPRMEMLSSWIQDMTDVCYKSLTSRERLIGLYNPYMAGQRLTFSFYEAAIRGGCCVIDSVGQTRVILHYYNAFRILGLIKELPLLEFLITQFSKARWLWLGGRPTKKGQFIKAFLMAWGRDATAAEKLARYLKQDSLSDFKNLRSPKSKTRRMPTIDPAPFLKSYRAVVENDYAEFPRECVNDFGLYFKHLKKVILDDYHDSILGYDLFSLGRIFLEIRQKLLKTFGFDDLVQQKMA
ncbi:hypothetical protein HDU96_002457, partial [Phlyctochytrium bullatum]